MSPDRVAFLVLSVYIIALISSKLVEGKKMSEGSNHRYYLSDYY